MSYDEDYLFALQLQNELDALEQNEALPEWPTERKNKNKRKNDDVDDNDLNATQNLVNPEWETIDPTPDIYSLFGAFDIKFFQGKLRCVELEWSKRMYQCAGICYQRRNGLGMSIIIRLSEPLLKLRSRRDLIETMLHEMIHAYLFIQNIREGNGGHGPNFKRIMENINRVAGTNITVYHTFHDEVAMYKTHIWRCNGICQHRKPFYGWVKRTCNRAPGPNDNWWARHQDSCSGTFVKVSAPEPKNKAKKAKIEDNKLPKITNWLNKSGSSKTTTNMPKNSTNQPRGAGGYTKMNGGGTVVLNPTAKSQNVITISDENTSRGSVLSNVSDAAAGGNLRNVVGFRDLNDSGTSVIRRPTFSAGGHVLGSTSANDSQHGVSPVESIRNIWANKFADTRNEPSTSLSETVKTETETSQRSKAKTTVTESTSAWEEIDDDILIHSVQNTVIEINDDGSNGSEASRESYDNGSTERRHSENDLKQQISIKQELLNDLGEDDENIEMIDDEFDGTLNESMEILTDNSVIDELFGRDTLMADFNNINDVVMRDPENIGNHDAEIVTCPICEDRMPRSDLTCHLDGCSGITVKINPRGRGKVVQSLPFYKNQTTATTKPSSSNRKVSTNEVEMLRRAGYTQEAIDRLTIETQEARDYNDRIMDELSRDDRQRRTSVIQQRPITNDEPIETISLDDGSSSSSVPEKHPCPVCNVAVDVNLINQHLDECLQANA